jgi:polar amino acid transport system permease protein
MMDANTISYWAIFIAEGFLVTIEMTLLGLTGGFVLGSLLALGDVFGNKLVRILINAYVEFFRGSPLIIQLLLFYYGIPPLTHYKWSAFTAGGIALMLNSAAYQKGYLKGAIEAVPKDQLQAAKAIGLTFRQTLAHIILPQAYRMVIPAWTNEFVSLGKSTAALLIIGVRELTSVAQTISSLTFKPFETYLGIAAIYFTWIYLSLKLTEHVYEKYRIPGLGERL